MENEAVNAEAAPSVETPNQEQFWKAHVLDAQRFEGTFDEYCELHSLKRGQLQQYRKKFGTTRRYRRKKEAAAFVKVECAESRASEQKRAEREGGMALPDPQWLAELICAVMSRR